MGLVTLFIGARRPYVPKPTKMRAVVIESYTSIQLEPGKEVDGGREGGGGGKQTYSAAEDHAESVAKRDSGV